MRSNVREKPQSKDDYSYIRSLLLSLRTSDLSLENLDVLLQIASFISLAEGFRLGFVKSNQPAQRLQMAALLKEMLKGEAKLQEVELEEPVEDLRIAVIGALRAYEPIDVAKKTIMVFGFEQSIPSEGSAPALEGLNLSRDLFARDFACPFLLWLPDYALTRLAREAPDLWGWRSGVFEFAPDPWAMAIVELAAVQGVYSDNLTLAEKKDHAAALEGLVRDYSELKKGERENRSYAAVLNRLGSILDQLGEYDEARNLYHQSLKIFQDLGDKSGVSWSLQGLGVLAQNTGDYEEARKLYQESLKIFQDLGDKSGVAITLLHLGMLAQNTGDYEEARKLYQESLKIFTDLGDKSGVARSLHQLGVLAQNITDYDEAIKLYQESLKIFKDLGDKSGVAIILLNLGKIHCSQGNNTEAIKLYQQSLDISKERGDREGIAETLMQSALLEEKDGHLSEALELIRQAELLFLETKSPMAIMAAHKARNVRKRLEKTQGKSWLERLFR
jgi:tetratricopeptide (TPR) repeat protein